MSLPWLRLYAEAIDDEKLRLLAFEDRWHFIAHLCLKAKGILDEPDKSLRQRKIAVKLGVQLAELDEIQRRLRSVGLLDDDGQPIAWERRQYVSDSSAERMRVYRERKRNGDVTVTPPDTEADTETEEKKKPARARDPLPEADMPPGLNETAWAQWVDYRKQLRKPLKPVSMPATQRKLAAFGSDQAAVVEQSIANGWLGLFDLKPGGKHETHQPIDNSAIGKVRRANAQARAARNTLDGDAERVDG